MAHTNRTISGSFELHPLQTHNTDKRMLFSRSMQYLLSGLVVLLLMVTHASATWACTRLSSFKYLYDMTIPFIWTVITHAHLLPQVQHTLPLLRRTPFLNACKFALSGLSICTHLFVFRYTGDYQYVCNYDVSIDRPSFVQGRVIIRGHSVYFRTMSRLWHCLPSSGN